MVFQLSASDSDKLVVGGALGTRRTRHLQVPARYGRRHRQQPAQPYTFVQSADVRAIAGDFSFDADATYQSLTGHFGIVGNNVQFSVDTVQSDRVFGNSFD